MAWFKKEKEELPTLPPLPELPSINESILPQKRTSPLVLHANQPTEGIMPPSNPLPTIPITTPTTLEKENIKTYLQSESNEIVSPSRVVHLPNKTSFDKKTKKAEPVYIRLDKFNEAVTAFEEIKEKIEEIETLLEKTKDIKKKEEQELQAWEHEMQVMKARIEHIDRTVLSKVE